MERSGMRSDFPVVVIGAGPVGLCTAIELARRGVDCLVVEKGDGRNEHPRANVVSPRSMEHFRRWGIDQKVIDAGLPRSHRTDVIFTTRLFGPEITRFSFPSISECATADPELLRHYPEVALSPYFKTAVGQNHLEPVLRAHAESLPSLALTLNREVVALQQEAEGVQLVLSTGGAGPTHVVTARYAVACDGARSFVRSALGVEMDGKPALGQSVGVYLRAPGLVERAGLGTGILYWTLAPGAHGVFIAIDGREEWVLQRHLGAGESLEDFDAKKAVQAALGGDFPFTIETVQPWVPRQLVARNYRVGRVFLAGDSAHLLSPTGGFGMNTGIGDAVDIGWKLAAHLQGWGSSALLDSYERERRPIAWRNAVEATDNRRHLDEATPPPEIEERTPRGAEIRHAWAERIQRQKKHFAAVGIHLGYRYDESPIVLGDGTPAPSDDPMNYCPTARPGSRAPHAWLAPGRSILDTFGPGYTLLRFGSDAPDAAGLSAAAGDLGVPFIVVDIDSAEATLLYAARLVLVRPDGHVAWRADQPPSDALTVLRKVTGAPDG